MKLLTVLGIVLIANQAQTQVYSDQCSHAGELLSRNFDKLKGKVVNESISRVGSKKVPSTLNVKKKISSTVYKIYTESFCAEKSYTVQVNRCNEVDLDTALGRGNKNFRNLFNIRVPVSRRIKLLLSLTNLRKDLPSVDRVELSKNVIQEMVAWSVLSGEYPKSKQTFLEMSSKMLADRVIGQKSYNEFSSQKVLNLFGFVSPANVIVNENEGNEFFYNLFDFSLSIYERANLIKENLAGIDRSSRVAEALAKDFILFANTNGVPSSWNDVILMLLKAKENGALFNSEFDKIVNSYEKRNRKLFGFEQSAEICFLENQIRTRNIISQRKVKEFYQVKDVTVELKVTSASLLPGEKEKFIISFNGLKAPELKVKSYFNNYSKKTVDLDDKKFLIEAKGKRIPMNPKNTLEAKLSKLNGDLVVDFLDTFRPRSILDGKVSVEIEVYEVRTLWFDKKIATRKLIFSESSEKVYLNIKSRSAKKVYVKYRISRSGRFFSSKNSKSKESNKVKM